MDSAAVLPIPPSLRVEALLLDEDGLTVLASAEATGAPCPLRGERADRVHSRATRTLADPPWATLAVLLRVAVRKFFCDNPVCPRQIFAERLAAIATSPQRPSAKVHPARCTDAVAVPGAVAQRVARAIWTPVGRTNASPTVCARSGCPISWPIAAMTLVSGSVKYRPGSG
jgi:zinc-finger of transposase IS204/IS1001/IS1096/IS1165